MLKYHADLNEIKLKFFLFLFIVHVMALSISESYISTSISFNLKSDTCLTKKSQLWKKTKLVFDVFFFVTKKEIHTDRIQLDIN